MKNLIDRERLRENRNRIAEKNKAGGPKDTKAAPAKGDGRGNPNRKGFAATAATATLRHNWYLQGRARPRCPHFANASVPQRWSQNGSRNARLTCVYFRAWTLDMSRATMQVPHLSNLCNANETWEDALREWLLRLPCADML